MMLILRNEPFFSGVCIGLLASIAIVKLHGYHIRNNLGPISHFTFYLGCSMHVIGLLGGSAEELESMSFTPLTFPLVRAYLKSKQI